MNFTIWILNRIKRTVLPNGKWQWVEDYRNLIMREKGLSILATFFFGLIWFVISFMSCMFFLDERETILLTLKCSLCLIPAFYVYNWLMALYEIYDVERMATWDTLKRPPEEYR